MGERELEPPALAAGGICSHLASGIDRRDDLSAAHDLLNLVGRFSVGAFDDLVHQDRAGGLMVGCADFYIAEHGRGLQAGKARSLPR